MSRYYDLDRKEYRETPAKCWRFFYLAEAQKPYPSVNPWVCKSLFSNQSNISNHPLLGVQKVSIVCPEMSQFVHIGWITRKTGKMKNPS